MMNNKPNRTPPWWLLGLLVAGSFVFAFWGTIQSLVNHWLNNEDYSHGIFVVPIAIYLAWERRAELKASGWGVDWRGLSVLSFAVIVFIVGELGAELFTTRVSLLLFVIGLVWFLYGYGALKTLRFPLAFLFLMLPLPGFIYRNITFPLQLIASAGAVGLLQTLGITTFREGNVIDMGFMQLQVVEACNGLRYILPLLTFAILFAYFGQRFFWKRAVLILTAIPMAIFANMIRVAATGWIGTYMGNQAAEGFLHAFSGWVVFMFCLFLFFLLSVVLRYLPGKVPEKRKPSPLLADDISGKGAPWLATVISMVVVLATPFIVNSLGKVPPVPLTRPLSSFPLEFHGWVGQRSEMDPKIWEAVGGQDYVIIDYKKSDQSRVDFYVAYYEYQRKAGDFVHSPRLCLPGAGWFIESNLIRSLKGPEKNLILNELIIEKDGQKHLVYFWYQGRGRNFTNEFAAKFYMVWDGLWKRRTDGALVRLITPLPYGRSLTQAREVMDLFALNASQELKRYLP